MIGDTFKGTILMCPLPHSLSRCNDPLRWLSLRTFAAEFGDQTSVGWELGSLMCLGMAFRVHRTSIGSLIQTAGHRGVRSLPKAAAQITSVGFEPVSGASRDQYLSYCATAIFWFACLMCPVCLVCVVYHWRENAPYYLFPLC